MPLRSLPALLTLVLATALAAGAVACGSEDESGPKPLSDSAYKKAINRAQTDFGSRAAGLELSDPSSPRDFKRSLDKLGVLIDRLTGRLEKVEAPAAVTAQHDRLVSELTEYGDAIDAQKGGLDSGDEKRIVSSATRIGKASTAFSEDFRATIGRINARLE